MALPLREQMFLSWLDPFGTGEEVPLFGLLAYLEPLLNSSLYEQRDSFIAGVSMPTKDEALDLLQVMLDSGFVIGWSTKDFQSRPTSVTDVRNPDQDPGGTFYALTPTGRAEAAIFKSLIDSEEGRRRTREFVRQFVDREAAELSFRVLLPTYLPEGVDPLPDLIVRDDDVSINYDGIVIEEALREFAETYDTPEQRLYEDLIQGITICVAERQLTSISAQLAWEWEQPAIRIRLHINVLERVPATQAEFKYAVIDESHREEARKIAQSMIEQAEN